MERVRLEPSRFAGRQARAHVRASTERWGLSDECRDELDLLVSEVVTNAAVHAGTAIDLTWRLDAGRVMVEVRDFGAGMPVVRGVSGERSNECGGWGLRLLAGISARWGVDVADPGKVVWFELARQ